jgi:hypothetical protein
MRIWVAALSEKSDVVSGNARLTKRLWQRLNAGVVTHKIRAQVSGIPIQHEFSRVVRVVGRVHDLRLIVPGSGQSSVLARNDE